MGKWEMVKLGEYIEQIRGVSYKPEDATEVEDSNHKPILRAHNIQDVGLNANNIVFVDKRKIKPQQYIKKGDIVICASSGSKALVGKAAQANINMDASFGAFCKLVRPSEVIVPEYLKHYFSSPRYRHLISEASAGANINNLRSEHINDLEIPLPPLEVQQQIADVLDCASALIEKRKAQIDKLDLLVKSQFIEMFGDPVTNPKGWEQHKLQEYIVFLTSGSRGWSSYFSDIGEMFLTIKNVKNSRLLLNNVQHVLPPDTKEAKRTKVRANDLLISITADLGRTAIVTADVAEHGAYINQHLSLVRLDTERISPLFASYYLESQAGKRQFDAKNQVGVKSGLNFDAINSLLIMSPPLSLQNKFADFVQQVEAQKSLLQASLQKLETNYKALMQKCFQGEIF